jgi:hypothetical protein
MNFVVRALGVLWLLVGAVVGIYIIFAVAIQRTGFTTPTGHFRR